MKKFEQVAYSHMMDDAERIPTLSDMSDGFSDAAIEAFYSLNIMRTQKKYALSHMKPRVKKMKLEERATYGGLSLEHQRKQNSKLKKLRRLRKKIQRSLEEC